MSAIALTLGSLRSQGRLAERQGRLAESSCEVTTASTDGSVTCDSSAGRGSALPLKTRNSPTCSFHRSASSQALPVGPLRSLPVIADDAFAGVAVRGVRQLGIRGG